VASRRSFKSDVSFLEKISIGAIGTQRVFENLAEQGHTPLELERGSRGFKIWKQIKIKRIRVPDILCVACARRFESRAKTTFEISMSHSLSDPERGWDFGLDGNDFVAIVGCERIGERPIDWKADDLVQYISVQQLRSAQAENHVFWIKPKGAEEGFEARIKWPAAIAKAAGVVSSVSENRIQYRQTASNRTITLKLAKQGLILTPLVAEGEVIVANQALAAVVPVVKSLPCAKSASAEHYISRLTSLSLSERYTAAKALSLFPMAEVSAALIEILNRSSEHIYVRLEAAASLARQGDERGWEFIRQCLADEYLQNRLETVIILGEISSDVSTNLLTNALLDDGQHTEIRAGAAWALGELRDRSALKSLVTSFAAVDQSIRVEAARALAKLASTFSPEILGEFPASDTDRRSGIAWALSKAGRVELEDLLDCLADDDARRWIAYVIGSQDQRRYIDEIELLKKRDPEVYFAVTVLWQIMSSWIYDLEEHG
jgi:HEAT repeat protein